MRTSIEFGLILILACVAAWGNWVVTGKPSGDAEKEMERVPLRDGEILLETLLEGDQGGLLWVDARREDEWKVDGLPGSIHVTTLSDDDVGTQLIRHQDELFGANRMVIYCSDVNCGMSHQLAGMIEADYAALFEGEILVLHGGHTALKKAGLIKGSN